MDKVYILNEIKRTAAANKGVPLARQRFLAETGIKQSDWWGVHWVRWNDALPEAGFAPNQLNVAYRKADLLHKYATFALELGRLPSVGDFRLKDRKDPEFPSHNTFARLGTKSEQLAQLADYCRERAGFEDVVRWRQEYSAARGDVPDRPKREEAEIGFVYLIKSGRFHKIGKTNSAGRREYELAIQLPERASTVHVIRTDDPNGIEAYWRQRFAAKRRNGEWFELDAADVAAFKRRKFM